MNPDVYYTNSGMYQVRFDDETIKLNISLSKSELQYLTEACNRELEGDW